MPDGFIAGLNGLLLGVAASRRIEAGCLLGTIPSYAMNFAYPKASLELIRTISRLKDLPLIPPNSRRASSEMDQQLAMIEERIREFFPTVNKEDDEEIADDRGGEGAALRHGKNRAALSGSKGGPGKGVGAQERT